MATASRSAAPDPTAAGLFPTFAFPLAFVETAMQAQQAQLEALMAWQQSIAALNKELWDEWVCRWGGGAPIDA